MGGRKDICNTRFGTSFEASHWRSLDPCGLLGISCSLSVHLFAFGTIALYLIEGSLFANAIFVLLYVPMMLLALASLYQAWRTDPGAVPLGARPLTTVRRASSGELESGRRNRAIRRCHKCNDNFKPSRAHHDSVTGRCIVKFDHFCPWVGNAVGALNHKFFVLFVGYTVGSCMLSLFLLFLRTLYCGTYTGDSDDRNRLGTSNPDTSDTNQVQGDEEQGSRFLERQYLPECEDWFQSYAVIILLVVSLVFLVFTCCMLFEQIETIQSNTSKIARMKMSVGQAGTELARVTEEFNEMFGGATNHVTWHWFLPLQVDFPRGMRKVVLGYEWDETFDAVPYEEANQESGSIEPSTNSARTIELASTPSITPKPGLKKPPPGSEGPDNGGEEGTFSGTPVVPAASRPKLTKRGNSRESLGAMNGTMA